MIQHHNKDSNEQALLGTDTKYLFGYAVSIWGREKADEALHEIVGKEFNKTSLRTLTRRELEQLKALLRTMLSENLTRQEREQLLAIRYELGWTNSTFQSFLRQHFGITTPNHLTTNQFKTCVKLLSQQL